jgi:DNA-directed RNA polymerase subunit RPC12/RpoP
LENIESKIRTESSLYNQGTQTAQLIHEIANSAYNHKPIIDKIKAGVARDISDEPKVTNNKNAFILGSGPSLDDSIQYLKEWEGAIFCTPSHALTLRYHNIIPDYILILDPFEQWSDLSGVDWLNTKTKLITHPGCRPDLIENWPNDILLYLENAGRPDSFYQDEQQKMYSWRDGDFRLSTFHFYIRTGITIFACSPPMELFAADILGYEKIFLAGCDFAFHSDKERFTSYTIDLSRWDYNTLIEKSKLVNTNNCIDNKEWDLFWDRFNTTFNEEKPIIPNWIENKHPLDPLDPALVKTNSGLLSAQIHLYYLKNLISAWRLCGKSLYTTDHGAMIQVPFHDIKAVIKYQGDFPLQDKKVINAICDNYLASTGAYVIETNKGVSFVESADYKNDLPKFMSEVSKRYTCAVCKSKLTSNDDKIHDDEECPNCHMGKIFRDVIIDVDKNMERINRYSKDK